MTHKAAVFARQWIKDAQEAAQGGTCAILFHMIFARILYVLSPNITILPTHNFKKIPLQIE